MEGKACLAALANQGLHSYFQSAEFSPLLGGLPEFQSKFWSPINKSVRTPEFILVYPTKLPTIDNEG